ncbi:hypothetical protein EDB84DRAFT_567917 [Lactarius hengduanensis]|nr:hypothetical protein EDB84DRAFT_567917 [Lactarius hengduanensis]
MKCSDVSSFRRRLLAFVAFLLSLANTFQYPDIPNKYTVRMPRQGAILSDGSLDSEVDVEFPTLEASSVEPPNPEYLKIHAAFAKVLHLCGAAEYIERLKGVPKRKGLCTRMGKRISRRTFGPKYQS